MPTYRRTDIAFERGEGPYLYSTDGRRFLDFASGIAVTCLGHSHPALVEALIEQGRKFWHCSNIFTIPGQQEMGEKFVRDTFADTVFFGNSGSEAVELGIKMIRKYHHASGNPHKTGIVCMRGAFHGRTLATIFAGGQESHIDGFGPAVQGFRHVAFGNMNELRNAIDDEVGGILFEPIQGEGGYRPAPDGFLEAVRETADEFGLLVMLDEVQCGNGRTGRLFAHQWSDMTPDIMATAKGMGGGFPVGACLATEEAARGMTAGTHGSTYGGNPLAMAVANAVWDVLTAPGFLDNVRIQGEALHAELRALVADYPEVYVEARGRGLMAGLKLADSLETRQVVDFVRERGLLTVAAGENVVRMAPPLIIGREEIDEAVALLRAAAEELMAEERDVA
ncbi:MAG: aspartate aminotransferase family protein [Rhodospirillaceae bacterium]|nr:aspartate aminotransferase family protein [Rhodospirillaceae bacterium]MYB11833.1 aspartate aminotransferase family protein [Rhodospirillaceae bacterium]MYI48237.1 aspartate aminotransferase family protein [Rhodospirillaceae bacterium]